MTYSNAGGHEVQQFGGRPINFHAPPKPNTRVQWSKRDTSGRVVTGSFRTIALLNRLNNLAVGNRHWKSGIAVIQPPYNTTCAASAGTHDKDACVDLYVPGVDWYAAQAFLRRNGFACWYRHPPTFPYHIHGLVLPPQGPSSSRSDDFRHGGFDVGLYVDGGASAYGSVRASSQIADYYAHAFGLSGQHTPNSDRSWFPANIKSTIFDLDAYVKARTK